MCQGSGNDGFTLVEVMVSLVIFLIASVGLLPLLLTSIQVNHDNSRNAQARRLAGEVMAEFQVIDYTGLLLAAEVLLMVGDIEVQPLVEQDVPHPGQSSPVTW